MKIAITQLSVGEEMPQHQDNEPIWQEREGRVEMPISETTTRHIVTNHVGFALYGRVDYSNFSQDYHYHGKKLPLPDDLETDYQLTLYQEPVARRASDIQNGDVLLDEQQRYCFVEYARPIRTLNEASIRALQSGKRYRHWQVWLFSHLLDMRTTSLRHPI